MAEFLGDIDSLPRNCIIEFFHESLGNIDFQLFLVRNGRIYKSEERFDVFLNTTRIYLPDHPYTYVGETYKKKRGRIMPAHGAQILIKAGKYYYQLLNCGDLTRLNWRRISRTELQLEYLFDDV